MYRYHNILPLRIRRVSFLFIPLLGLVLLLHSYFPETIYLDTLVGFSESLLSPTAALSPWSSAFEASSGKWVPRDPPYASVSHYRTLNRHKSGWVWKGCPVPYDSTGAPLPQNSELREALEAERLVNLMNWVWQPSRGKLVPYDPLDFVARLLKSPGGLIMLGDSITRQHHDTLTLFLDQNGISRDSTKTNHTTRYVLRPNHPMTELIRERAGVPESRVRRPFLTLVEDHMILPERDIRIIANAPKEWVWPIRHHPHEENLVEVLNELVKPIEGEEEHGVEKNSILLFSTGPHWSRSRLPIPQTGYEIERAAMLQIYQRVVNTLIGRFSHLPRTTMFYRSSAAPHPHCERHSKPYPSFAVAQRDDARMYQIQIEGYEKMSTGISVQAVEGGQNASVSQSKEQKELEEKNRRYRKEHGRWDWDLWGAYNDMWKKVIATQARYSEAAAGEEVEAKWHYLDISEMSVQRPDAHSEPGKDCLHYCSPTIYEDWTRLLYHQLFLLGEVDGPADLRNRTREDMFSE